MKKPIVFLGPSLPVAEARELLDADFRPPVRRDDVLAAAREQPPFIAIIDGVFMQTLAPSPSEVLRALRLGIPMLGSSSLGALRAVELSPFGMVGIGQIYQWFQDGTLDADDEVALVFDEATSFALSEPMVNIRHALKAAVDSGLLTAAREQVLIGVGKELYFPERSWRRLFREARAVLDADLLERLEKFVAAGDYDLKAHDARLLLREAARWVERGEASRAGASGPQHFSLG